MNRPLTEELQSVLRQHSLDAPAPQSTIDAVFGRLGIDQEATRPVAAATDGGVGQDRDRRSRRGLVLWLASVAAAVVVLGGAVGLIRWNGQDSHSRTSSSAGMAAPNSQAAASGAGAGALRLPGQAVAPDVTGRTSTRAGGGWLAALVSCSSGDLTTSGTVSGPADGPSAGVSVGYASCVQADGLSGAGAVVLYREPAGSSTATVLRVLIASSSSLRLMSVAFDGTTVAVRAIDGAAGPDLGSVSDYRFTIAADGSVVAQRTTPVAPACTAADLRLSIVDGRSGAVIRLADAGGRACAVNGVPLVAARSGPSAGVALPPVVLAPGSAGWGSPAVVVLRPGSVASAGLRPPAEDALPTCVGSVRLLEVGLVGTGTIGALDYRGPYCTGRVSALVSGTEG